MLRDCSQPGSSVMESSRQEYWSRLPFPSPEDLPDPEIESGSPVLEEDSLPFEIQGRYVFKFLLFLFFITKIILKFKNSYFRQLSGKHMELINFKN